MTIIEGVGDEVIQFFVVVFIIVIGLLAWRSTNIAEQPFIRAVLVLEMMTRQRSETNQTNNTVDDSSIDTGQRSSSNSLEEESGNPSESNSKKETSELDSDIPNENVSGNDSNMTENNQVQSETEQSSSSVECTTRHMEKRIAKGDQHNSLAEGEKSVSDDKVALEGTSCEGNPHVDDSSRAEEECNTPGIIRIRLKYLNDTQKLVEGNLEEQLGDFKRRHFGLEIQTNKLVRLIFNGHVLQSDSETLQNYGLFDNCVVHCLVHNQQVTNSSTGSGNATDAGRANGVDLREWDMDNHLFGSLSFILVAAWYCRYTYAQLFTTTTTVALVCLTGVFFVSLLGVYLPDQGRERQ
ncbi:hypothetical protein J437_LFUL003978 [Ladona fulva]|uniref:Ubiquitin-like domain-containing protein n=1 Tax=Ladona fulva TaxID=123851 RepID=A0A8K0K3Y5_LADFU|nr:hypothetical protein J437_LFUL003978 [Ladona fulva]